MSLSKLGPTDRSRTAEELEQLKLCLECWSTLREAWWTLGKGSLSVSKTCLECGQRYAYIVYHYEEEVQFTSE